MLRTAEGGTFMVVSLPRKINKSRPQVRRCIVETLSNNLFSFMVVNTSKSSLTLPKNWKVGQLMEVLTMIVPLKDVLLVKPVNSVPIYKRKQNKKQQLAHHQQATTNDKEN